MWRSQSNQKDPDNYNDSVDLRRSGISGLSFGDLPELSRAEEKEAMKNNNNKLANYIDNVRRLQKVKMMMIKMILIIMTMILKMMIIMMMMIKMMMIKMMLIIIMMIMKENGRMIRQIEVIETSQTKEINDLKHIYDREIEDLKVMKIIMMR